MSNNKNFIHSIEVFDLKTKNDNYNTVVHDSKMIEKLLKILKLKIKQIKKMQKIKTVILIIIN